MARILVVDDQDRTMDLLRRSLAGHEFVGPARDARSAVAALVAGGVDLVLLDVDFRIPDADLVGVQPGIDAAALEAARRWQGLHILRHLRARWPALPVLVMTAREELSLEDQSELAEEEYSYLLANDAVDARSLSAQIARILSAQGGAVVDGPVFWGPSPSMQRIRERLSALARGRLPVMLLGPTGTGKSLIARHFVHPKSGRAGRFVSLDLSTVPKDLMAAQLFGAVRGAYTGAVADRPGAFEVADGGTLFLDEIGNLTEDAQKMLLAVLQEGVVTRVGDLQERPVDVKVVVATHEDLASRVREGRFRGDLHMRLNPAAAIRLPALEERIGDLPALILHAVQQALERPYLHGLLDDYRTQNQLGRARVEVRLGGVVPDRRAGRILWYIPDRSLRLLRGRGWEGNLRELAMTLENAALFVLTEALASPGGERADVLHLRPKVLRDLFGAPGAGGAGHSAHAPGQVVDAPRFEVQLRAHDALNKVSADCERQYFIQLFRQCDGDFAAMAVVLLGAADHARKVQLRFNQLGLKVRELREVAG